MVQLASNLPTDAAGLAFAGPADYKPAGRRVGATDYANASVSLALELTLSAPTLTVAGAYTSGDYVGPSAVPASFAGVAVEAGARARVRSLRIVDKTTTAAVDLELWLFGATVTVPTDNQPWDLTDAHALLCQAVIAIPAAGWRATASNKVYSAGGLDYVVAPSATAMFYALVARGPTPTWANGDLQLALGVEQG